MSRSGRTGLGLNMQLTGTSEEEFEKFTDEFTDEMMSDVMMRSVAKAGLLVKREMERRLARHDSIANRHREKGGPKAWRKWKARRQVKDSIVVDIRRADDNTLLMTVGPSAAAPYKAAYVAYWLEFGREAWYWGRRGSETEGLPTIEPQPFVRPAIMATRAGVRAQIRRELTEFVRK